MRMQYWIILTQITNLSSIDYIDSIVIWHKKAIMLKILEYLVGETSKT